MKLEQRWEFQAWTSRVPATREERATVQQELVSPGGTKQQRQKEGRDCGDSSAVVKFIKFTANF